MAKRVTAVGLSLLLLTACSSGNAPEANQGQKADEQRTSVITDMQATHTWELVNGTPESTPEETPAP